MASAVVVVVVVAGGAAATALAASAGSLGGAFFKLTGTDKTPDVGSLGPFRFTAVAVLDRLGARSQNIWRKPHCCYSCGSPTRGTFAICDVDLLIVVGRLLGRQPAVQAASPLLDLKAEALTKGQHESRA